MQICTRFLLLALCLYTLPLAAQPGTSRSIHEPLPGDQVLYTYWSPLDSAPVSNGNTSVWTYNLMPDSANQADTVTWLPKGMPPWPGYPQSNIKAQHRPRNTYYNFLGNRDAYFLSDAEGLHYEGYSNFSLIDQGPAVYQVMGSRLAWPMEYQDVALDSVEADMYGLVQQNYFATNLIQMEATGTLNLNGIVYGDIMLIHEYDFNRSGTLSSPEVLKGYEEAWYFYSASQKFPVLTLHYFAFDSSYVPLTSTVLATSNPESWTPEFDVYPTPFGAEFRVGGNRKWQALVVYDLQGKEMTRLENKSRARTVRISSAGWKSGMYMLRVQDENGEWTVKKLVKK